MCDTGKYRDIHERITNELGELRYGFVSKIFEDEVEGAKYLNEPEFSTILNKWLAKDPERSWKIWKDFDVEHGCKIFEKHAQELNLKMDYWYFSGITVGKFVECFDHETPSLYKFLRSCA